MDDSYVESYICTIGKIRTAEPEGKTIKLQITEEEEAKEAAAAAEGEMALFPVAGGLPQPMKAVVVGYTLTSKKVKSFLQPKLEGLARNKGILFVPIDHTIPLSQQGPFDIVLHKLSGKEWQHVLEDYWQTHPEVKVLDPPDAIQHVYNRQYMLEDVADLNLSDAYGSVGVPKQLVIKKDPSSIPVVVAIAGLRLPLVVKPLVANSHELSLAYDQDSLQKLEPPLILQEFINHGYSLLLKKEKAIPVQPDRVVIANGPAFRCVLMEDFLSELAKKLKRNTTAYENYHRIYVPHGTPLKCEPREPLLGILLLGCNISTTTLSVVQEV